MSDLRACGPPTSFFVHLSSSAVTQARTVDKSRDDNVVRIVGELEEMMCIVCVSVTKGE